MQTIEELLQTNPDAAHFMADLASGVALADAVRSHFADFFGKNAEEGEAEESEVQAENPAAEQPEQPAMYQPLEARDDLNEPEIDFLSTPSNSFWQ